MAWVRAPGPTLRSLVLLFLRLGAIGFGGGMAVIAMMEKEIVQRRKILPHEELLHGLALGQILGSFATNAAFFVGHRFFGMLGGLACAAAFMTPSVILVIGLSWLYFTYHTIPALHAAMRGLGPVVIALILSAVWSLGRKAVRTWPSRFLALAALALALFKVNCLLPLGLGAATGLWAGKAALTGGPKDAGKPRDMPAMVLLGQIPLTGGIAPVSLLATGWTFLKIGFTFFGGGFVLVPVLHQKLVVTLGWLTPKEFLDGVAISNLTPGPIAVLATFAGFRMQGPLGALTATVAMFLPALVLMAFLSHFYERFRDLHRAQNLLAGLAPAMVGLILGSACLLAPGALHGWRELALCVLALVALVRFKWHPALALGMGALLSLGGWVR